MVYVTTLTAWLISRIYKRGCNKEKKHSERETLGVKTVIFISGKNVILFFLKKKRKKRKRTEITC